MRWLWLGMALFAAMGTGRAERPFPAAVVSADQLTPAEVKTSALPAAVVAWVRNEETFQGEDGKLRASLQVIRADLDDDGHADYLVQEPESYTGGSIYWIFSSERDGCRPLGRVQGWFYLAEPVNGHAQIVADARAGGGEFVRTLFVFKDGEYREQRAATYRETDDGEVYLREEKPRG
jgi:hypothetical protein